ncbi:histidine phosphatase family protein [Brevibacterium litoralis]|uniref:histidine phosphatase family protein n=1 Tax=Brevibacterium litoralis TaxID=3138935 RepID=UPI0032EF60F3
MSNFLGRALGSGLLTRGEGFTDVWLVRHGQQIRASKDSPESIAYDAPLSDTGRAQAECTGRYLAGAGLDAVYASDLSRAKDTGAAIAAHHGVAPQVVEAVREIGIFRDVPLDRSFEEAVGAERARQAATDMVRDLTWDSVPLSEPSADFRARVHGAVWEIARAHPGQRVAIACHGGVVNAVLAQEYGLDRDFLFRPAHAGVTRVRFATGGADGPSGALTSTEFPLPGERAIVLTANEIAHLEAEDLLTF